MSLNLRLEGYPLPPHLERPYESEPEIGRISVTSPFGKALIGKEEGDTLTIKTPGGTKEFEVLEIC